MFVMSHGRMRDRDVSDKADIHLLPEHSKLKPSLQCQTVIQRCHAYAGLLHSTQNLQPSFSVDRFRCSAGAPERRQNYLWELPLGTSLPMQFGLF